MKRGAGAWILLVAVVLATLAYVVYPVANVLRESVATFDAGRASGFTLEHYRGALLTNEGRVLSAIWNSIWVSAAGTVLAAAVGVPLAFLFSTCRFPGRMLLSALAYAPLTLPPVVGMFAFYMLVGRVGLIPMKLGEWFGDGRPLGAIEGIPAVLLVHAYSFSVFFYALTASALRRLDPSLAEAARTLGAGRWTVLARVTAPALAPALAGAAALSFMVSMGSFSAPLLLANNKPFLSVWIYEASYAEGVGKPDFGLAAAESVVGITICMAFLLLTRRLAGRGGWAARGTRAASLRDTSPARQAILGAAAAAAVFLLLLPQIRIALVAVSDYPRWSRGVLPPDFTDLNFKAIFTSRHRLLPIANSAWNSALALSAALALGLGAAWVLARLRFRGAALLDVALMLPFALPGTVIAFSLLRAFNAPTPQTLGMALGGTLWLLPLAYFVRSVPLAVRPLTAALQSADPSHEEASRTLGAGPVRTFMKVTLPHLWPAVAAAGLLIYVTCLGEFVVSIMVATTDNTPIGVQIFRELQSSAAGIGRAAAYSMILIVLMIGVFLVQAALLRKSKASPF